VIQLVTEAAPVTDVTKHSQGLLTDSYTDHHLTTVLTSGGFRALFIQERRHQR
jgi:hypothetical protein